METQQKEKEENGHPETYMIGIAGGSGSGKTTFTNRLKNLFGDGITVLYYDNYYREQGRVPLEERKKLNYDQPGAFDTDLLLQQLQELKAGRAIESPLYDFHLYNRSEKTVHMEPRRVIVLDGIFALADERLRNQMDLRVYVEADADVRLLRRMLRDINERGRDAEDAIYQYLTVAKPMHERFVEPTRKFADIILNGGRNEVALGLVAARIADALREEEQREEKENKTTEK